MRNMKQQRKRYLEILQKRTGVRINLFDLIGNSSSSAILNQQYNTGRAVDLLAGEKLYLIAEMHSELRNG